MSVVPVDLYGVIVRGPEGEWLDYGSLRPNPEMSRAAWNDFANKAMGGWRKENVPVRIKRFTLVEKEK